MPLQGIERHNKKHTDDVHGALVQGAVVHILIWREYVRS
jgi:hypothetical protein